MEIKYIKLAPDSFIRIYDNGNIGYIMNERTNIDKIYDSIGADFLKEISREVQSVEDVVQKLVLCYKDADYGLIMKDLKNFIEELFENQFIEAGEFIDEIINKKEHIDPNDTSFKPIEKISINNRINQKDSSSFWFESDKNNPILKALHIELTNKCNERCVHCFIPNSEKERGINISLPLFKKIIDQFVELGGVRVILSGGEPLLNENLKSFLKYCRKKDLSISLFSNLLKLDDDLINVLTEVGVANVQVSLYSMNEESHDRVTQIKGSFKKTLNSILKLKENNIPVSISCPIMKGNKDSFDGVVRFAISENIPFKTDIYIMAQTDYNKDNLNSRLNGEEIKNALRILIKNNYDKILSEYSDNAKIIEQDMPLCTAGLSMLCVNAHGDVSPCVSLGGLKGGNILDKTLKEIWKDSENINRIRKIRQKDFTKCLQCDFRQYCSMCMGKNLTECDGDIFVIPSFCCELAKITKETIEFELKEKAESLERT